MAHQKLEITEIDNDKRFISLSDGRQYLFDDEASGQLISSWRPGIAVWIEAVGYPQNGFELRPVNDIASAAIVICQG